VRDRVSESRSIYCIFTSFN